MININNQISNIIKKARKASKKVAIERLRNEAHKIEKKYNLALIEVINEWEKEFNAYYKKHGIGNKLFKEATQFFPNGRGITFNKEKSDDDLLAYNLLYGYAKIGDYVSDHLFGIEIYQKPEKLKIEGEELVDAHFRDFAFDTGLMIETLVTYNMLAFNNFGNVSVINAGSEGFLLANTDIIQAIENRANMLAGNWSDRVFQTLKQRIAKSCFVEGKHPTLGAWGPSGGTKNSVAADILHFFNGNKSRAKTVARTETAVMQSEETWIFNKRSGIQKHGWAATLHSKTPPRDEHRMNHAHVVAVGEPFPNGQLRVGEGTARQTVNCRCANYGLPEGTIDPWHGENFESMMIKSDRLFDLSASSTRPSKPVIKPKPKPKPKKKLTTIMGRTFDLNNEKQYEEYLLWNWVHGSKRKASEIMKISCKNQFNLQGKIYRTRKTKFNINTSDTIKGKKSVQAIYDITQKEFADQGIKSVRLYRGTKKYYDISEVGVLESWTTSTDVAKIFNGKNIYYEDVPVNRILSYHKSKLWKNGKYGQQFEYIVMR